MAGKKKMVQTTVRLDPEMLREMQYYLSLEGMSLAKFFAKQAEEFIRAYRRSHPDRVPGGKHGSH